MSGEPLRIGVIGAGEMAVSSHLPVLLALEGARVAWIADRDAARAEMVGRAFGVKARVAASDPRDLPPADVALLALPYGAREPYYAALAARGTAVYAEKPFARTTAEHDARCALFGPARLACGLQRRSWGPARALRELVRSGPFGRLLAARVELGSPGLTPGGGYVGDPRLAGGGLLFEVGVHAVDLALFCTDSVDVDVRSAKVELHAGLDVHVEAEARVLTENGSAFDLSILSSALRFTALANSFTFEHADLVFSAWGDGAMRVKPRGGGPAFSISAEAMTYPRTSAQAVHAHWSRFLQGLREGEPNETSAGASRLSTSVIEQVYARGEG
jgi:predicted dehydrogenase